MKNVPNHQPAIEVVSQLGRITVPCFFSRRSLPFLQPFLQLGCLVVPGEAPKFQHIYEGNLHSDHNWLVVDLPPWKIWKSLGWWHSQYMENKKCSSHHQPDKIAVCFWLFRVPDVCLGPMGTWRVCAGKGASFLLGLPSSPSSSALIGRRHPENSGLIYPLVIQHSYWKWPFIMSCPIKKCDCPYLC